jgi:hypothetical protein
MKQFNRMVEFLKKSKAGKATLGKKASKKWETFDRRKPSL